VPIGVVDWFIYNVLAGLLDEEKRFFSGGLKRLEAVTPLLKILVAEEDAKMFVEGAPGVDLV